MNLFNCFKIKSGLEDQMLGCVVAEERPDLEEAKNQLIVSNSIMKNENSIQLSYLIACEMSIIPIFLKNIFY